MYGTTNRSVSILIMFLSCPTIIKADDIASVLEGASSNNSKINALQRIGVMPIDQRTEQLMITVIRLTTHSNDKVRTVAIDALHSFGKKAVPVLVPLLQARDNESVFAASTALGKMGTHASEAAEPLAKLIDDSICTPGTVP